MDSIRVEGDSVNLQVDVALFKQRRFQQVPQDWSSSRAKRSSKLMAILVDQGQTFN